MAPSRPAVAHNASFEAALYHIFPNLDTCPMGLRYPSFTHYGIEYRSTG